jgi:hypothetical protein
VNRTCALSARDADGNEVRLRGSIQKVGSDIQLGIQPE